ncbi:MAG: hypothetical protein MZW92_28015 [Comamonadaceae bacterium]|nr:hypothetical protein [Comamonadaceae bacterium]
MIFNQTMEVERLLVMAPAIGVMERILGTLRRARAGSARSVRLPSPKAPGDCAPHRRHGAGRSRRPDSCVPRRLAADAPRHRDARICARQARRQRGVRRVPAGAPCKIFGELRLHGRVRAGAGAARRARPAHAVRGDVEDPAEPDRRPRGDWD